MGIASSDTRHICGGTASDASPSSLRTKREGANSEEGALNAELCADNHGDRLTTGEDAGVGSVGVSSANNVPLI